VLKPGVEKGDDAKKEEIRAYLKETVAPYKVPKVIEFLDAAPHQRRWARSSSASSRSSSRTS
jgi:acyl-coenzyme A synthetase/AMP-(fatty) acid ligase